MQEVVMSNTHLTSSLLENYSIYCKQIYDQIYIYISSIFHLKPGFVGSRKPTRNNIEWFQRSLLSLQAISIKVSVWNKGGIPNVPTWHCHCHPASHCQVDCWMVRWFEVEGVVS